jgi:tetratricopeptide (TPR) repeat protein
MRLQRQAGLGAALLGLLFASAAWAGPADDGNAGLQALQEGNYARAISLFTRALNSGKLSPDDKEFAYSQRGTAYLKSGKATAAIADFKRALRLKPDDPDAQSGLEEAQSQSDSGPMAPASRSSAQNPEQAAQAGMDVLNAGDYSKAIQLFTRAINAERLSPDEQELALLSRGKAYLQSGATANAITDLNRALHMKPDDSDAQATFGKALGQMHPRTPVTGIDAATCSKNYSTVGSVFTGKSYTAFADYPDLPPMDAFAGVYTALSVYTPVPGVAWTMSSANLDAGTLTATITLQGTSRTINLDARIEPVGGGSRITIREVVPALFPTIDLKGSLCSTLTDASKG